MGKKKVLNKNQVSIFDFIKNFDELVNVDHLDFECERTFENIMEFSSGEEKTSVGIETIISNIDNNISIETVSKECTSLDTNINIVSHIETSLSDVPDQYKVFVKIHQGDKNALNDFVRDNYRLVHKFAKKRYNTYKILEYDDYVSEGLAGMLEAINKFDINRNLCFSTYAATWIKAKMLRAEQNFCSTIRIPCNIREKIGKYNKAKEALNTLLNREPSQEEIAKESKLSLKDVLIIEGLPKVTTSINRECNDDSDNELVDILVCTNECDEVEERVNTSMMQDDIRWIMNKLDEESKMVIQMKFFENMSPTAIAKKLAMSKEKVVDIEKKAMVMLKKLAQLNGLNEYLS